MISWRCRARRIQFVQLFNPSARAEFWSLYWRTPGQCQPRTRRNVLWPRGCCIYLSVYETQHSAVEKMTCHVWRESPFRVNRCLGSSVATQSPMWPALSLSLSLFLQASIIGCWESGNQCWLILFIVGRLSADSALSFPFSLTMKQPVINDHLSPLHYHHSNLCSA